MSYGNAIRVPMSVVDKVIEASSGQAKELISKIKSSSSYLRFVEMYPGNIPANVLKAFRTYLKDAPNTPYKAEIEFLYHAARNPNSVTVKSLSMLPAMLQAFMKEELVEGYLFERGENGALTPYLYMGSTYTPQSKYTTESVRVELSNMTYDGEQKTKTLSINRSTLLAAYKQVHSEKADRLEKTIADLEEKIQESEEEISEVEESDEPKAVKAKQKLR